MSLVEIPVFVALFDGDPAAEGKEPPQAQRAEATTWQHDGNSTTWKNVEVVRWPTQPGWPVLTHGAALQTREGTDYRAARALDAPVTPEKRREIVVRPGNMVIGYLAGGGKRPFGSGPYDVGPYQGNPIGGLIYALKRIAAEPLFSYLPAPPAPSWDTDAPGVPSWTPQQPAAPSWGAQPVGSPSWARVSPAAPGAWPEVGGADV